MPAVKQRQLEFLKPWLEGDAPNQLGEWGMHCPLPTHGKGNGDRTRSASLNVKNGKWYCNACSTGGAVSTLIRSLRDRQIAEELAYRDVGRGPNYVEILEEDKPFDENKVARWHRALLTNREARTAFTRRRGLTVETLKRFQLGWDATKKAYTIPIRDRAGSLINIRRYQLDPPPDRRKIWGVTGHNAPQLYPISQLDDHDEIIICEGELDALMLIQQGFAAVTRTSTADAWRPNWNHLFEDKIVYLCHDRDDKGQLANAKLEHELRNIAREVCIVELPYPVDPKHGKDVTDYFHEDKHTALDFKRLMGETTSVVRDPVIAERELVDVGVLDSFGSDKAGQKLRMRVTITGKRQPPYLLPKDVRFSCPQSAGAKCQICPMNDNDGRMARHIDSHDPLLLEMMGSTAQQMGEHLRKVIGAQKCNLLDAEVEEFRSVEELYVRPSVDRRVSQASGDYTTRRIVSVGRHDTLPNNTVEVVGAIFPSPKGQQNEFQAWEVSKLETSIDRFEVTPEVRKALKTLQSRKPLAKCVEIAKWHEQHTTRIVGRLELHVLVDLVYHSLIAFPFLGQLEPRGWLEALVVGDTRTGKSAVGQGLLDCYEAGEMVSCESATFAGIVGGLQQLGSGKEWEVTWGAIPINDRRLVHLDEVSGLTHEQIAQMSSIRSSGVAQLTKIRSEQTWARTRLVWYGNPRDRRMADYTYGVQAIRPLIGNNEDIARFDLAMSVRADEVRSEDINRDWNPNGNGSGSGHYDADTLRLGVLWAWSRLPEHVVWGDGAEQAVLDAAMDLGHRYTESPPLLQAANARFKVARVAVALAARTFSTTDGEHVLVERVHVSDAVRLIDRLYGGPGFGYAELSKEAIEDYKAAEAARDEAKAWLVSHRGISKFLRSMTGTFRRQDLEDMMNLSKEEANAMVGTMWKMRLISRKGANIVIQPVLHELLREVKE